MKWILVASLKPLITSKYIDINDNTGTPQIQFDGSGNAYIADQLTMGASGSIVVGSSDVVLDNTGLILKGVTSYADIDSLRWKYSSTNVATMWSITDTGQATSTLNLHSKPYSGGSYGHIDIVAESASGAASRLFMGGTANGATQGPDISYVFYNTSVSRIGGQVVQCSTSGTSASLTVSGAVRYRVTYIAVIRASGGNVTTRSGSLGVNANDTFTLGGTANDFKIYVSAGGTFAWMRNAGAETYDITIWGIYS